MPLKALNFNYRPISDLTPLKGMLLQWLEGPGRHCTDFSPLRGMPLTYLYAPEARVADLTPLQGMSLTFLDIGGASISDLTPLKGMPLRYLSVGGSELKDIAALKGMPLQRLLLRDTRVTDLSPLKGMSALRHLECRGRPIADLSPLRGLALKELILRDTRVADLAPLEKMKSLRHLECRGTPISDLTPLKEIPLTELAISQTDVTDLTALKGMPLTSLSCSYCRVTDLSPLGRMPLTVLSCAMTQVSDFSSLAGMPLEVLAVEVRLFDTALEKIQRSLPLTTMYTRVANPSPDEFWTFLKARRRSAEQFASETAALPAKEQVEAVKAKLNGDDVGDGEYGRIGDLDCKLEEDDVTEVILALYGEERPIQQRPRDWFNRVTWDVTPLMAFSKLKKLTLTGGPHWLDISAVKFLPLEELNCTDAIAFKNSGVLKAIATLKTINGKPAAEYWKTLPAKMNANRK